MPQDHHNWVVLASLLRPQGRKGELLAELLTDFPERFTDDPDVFLAPPGFDGPPSTARPFKVVSSWLPHGRNQGRVVLGFSGISSIEEAERLAGLEVLVPETERVELTDDSVYISQLIGCTVYDRGTPVGTVLDVQFLTSADGKRRLPDAAPLLTVEHGAAEALIPFAKDFLLSLDLPEKKILMQLPEGLLDLNIGKPQPPPA